jgi:hypothetical protein
MNKNLIKFVVDHGTINKTNLLAVLNGLDSERAERLVSVMFGITDLPVLPNKVKSKDPEYSECTLDSYDVIEDRVNYRAKVTTVRYFNTQEEADKAVRYGRYWVGEKRESDDYKVQASFTYDIGSSMSLNNWLDSEPVEE